ncbi:unnamed protein product [Lymnaea stagnalis]|uniref:D-serine dehydratase n=1 Tax=Lymnaea stagnalis TaxID=6523 RepID=A0AAV2HYH0_LYMST
MSTKLSDLHTPCFLVDLQKVQQNCDHMIETCRKLNIKLRPHTKTHKTIEAAILQTKGSKRCIAVSTLAEAEFYAENGFDDILLAYPITADKINRCLALTIKLQKFHVMVSGLEGLECLETHAQFLPKEKFWSLFLDIDVGYGRTGFLWDGGDILDAAVRVNNNSLQLRLEQLYVHCGNSYGVKTSSERIKLQETNIHRLQQLQKRLMNYGFNCTYGVGSTPTCSLPIEDNKVLAEFHPGNYVFYDYMQHLFGSCRESNIACRVMTRVIAHKPEKNIIVVDCGWMALGLDGKMERPLDFCLIQGENNLRLLDMTQEIGKIVAKEGELDCRLYPVGMILYIIPFHSCCTSSLHAEYQIHNGDDVVATWKPVRGW